MSNRADEVRSGWLRALACALVLIGCTNKQPQKANEPNADAGMGRDCEALGCASTEQPIDWTADAPTYAAHIRVVDLAGEPVPEAKVRVSDRELVSDAEGRAVLKPVQARGAATLRVEKGGSMPHVGRTDAFKSGQRTQEVAVVPLAVDKDVDPTKPIAVAADGGSVSIKGRALVDERGVRATKAHVELATPDAKSSPSIARVGSDEGIDRRGAPALIGDMLGMFYVRFSDPSGAELKLADGEVGRVSVKFSPDAKAKAGDEVPLWTLDEKSGRWSEQSKCVVRETKRGSETAKVCEGAVAHFSYWAAAFPVEIQDPGALGCATAKAELDPKACYRVEVESWSLGACDAAGERCREAKVEHPTFVAAEGNQPAYCGIVPGATTYRAALVYHVDATDCDPMLKIPSGRHVKLTAPIALDSFKDALGSDILLSFTLDPDRECANLCKQVSIAIGDDDLASDPWLDDDDDGYYATASGEAQLTPWMAADCGDKDEKKHPFAVEPFCATDDLDCDGNTPSVKTYSDVSYTRWNAECFACRQLAEAKETTGNYYDENCDGKVEDRDGDSVKEPADCDDYNASINPSATEVVGNVRDEDCDGRTPDYDGDGVPAPADVGLASKLKLDPATFTDCNDFDAEIHPGVDPEEEAGALVPFFYTLGEEVRRNEWFCSLFSGGEPNSNFYYYVRDLNCDGVFTDMDGDGATEPGDLSFGENLAFDCNDLDPRITSSTQTNPKCSSSELPNDEGCQARPPSVAVCPAIAVPGGALPTSCAETLDSEGHGTGSAVCSYVGWPDGNPLSLEPGKVWGPCDGDGPLPDCPQGSSCGGPLMYTDAFTAYLESAYTQGEPLFFKGMCFDECPIR